MNSDKKKRLIIPVATLMVAIVMMAGVGYAAISSTFTVNGNSTAGGEFKVTIDNYDNTNKLFKDVKIPYVVDTLNGVATNKVVADEYVLVKDKTVKVTDNTGLSGDYTVTATATSETIGTKLGANCTLVTTLEPTVAGTTSPYTGNQTFTLKVVLKVNGADVVINDPANDLKLQDIIVTITATHTTP